MNTVTFDKDLGDSYRMNPDVKEKWIAALRSGDYLQSTGRLKRDEEGRGKKVSYCCLGVLCELHGKSHNPPIDFIKREHGIWVYPETSKNPESKTAGSLLPDGVVKWAGLQYKKELYEATISKVDGTSYDVQTVNPPGLLTFLNDSSLFNFDEIANFIERYM